MGKGERNIQILVADSHPVFREGLRGLLQSEADLRVVAEAGDGLEALNLAKVLQPDLLLLELVLPELPGNDVLRRLAECGSKVPRVVILTSVSDKSRLADSIRLGAHGVVRKDQSVKVLIRCIRKVMQGQYCVGTESYPDSSLAVQSLADPVVSPSAPQRWGITKREQEMIRSIVAGYSNREISQRYGISEDTVKHHLSSVFDKLGVYNRLELALFALHHGLVGKAQSTYNSDSSMQDRDADPNPG